MVDDLLSGENVITKSDSASESVTIIVQPSAAHPDILSVQDAMHQVLDFFDLLVPEGQSDGSLIWNLEMASTNSPLTVVGNPRSTRPDVDVSMIARQQRRAVADDIRALTSGGKPALPLNRKRRDILKRMFKRNLSGIGRTNLSIDSSHEVVLITPRTAESGIKALEADEREFDDLLLSNRGRTEIGSIEGFLQEVGTDYNQPAIRLRERKSDRDIWCRIDAEMQHAISESTSLDDIWGRQRVIVRGRIVFDAAGQIARVYATSVKPLNARAMTLHDIKDVQFAPSLSAEAYLDKLRDGDLG